MTLAQKIRDHLTKHPNAKAADVAEKFNTSAPYVYVVRSGMKTKGDSAEAPKPKRKYTKKAKPDWQTVFVATSDTPMPITMEEPAATATATATDVDATLAARGEKYGKFVEHAEVTYRLKNVLRDHAARMGKSFAFDQAEALDMICHKLGRIINGDPNYADSWIDIAGYAKLVADRLETGKEV